MQILDTLPVTGDRIVRLKLRGHISAEVLGPGLRAFVETNERQLRCGPGLSIKLSQEPHALDLVISGLADLSSDDSDLTDLIHARSVSDLFSAEGKKLSLSSEAIQHAVRLDTSDFETLFDAIYNFNRRPITPRARKLLPNQSSMYRHLNLNSLMDSLNEKYTLLDNTANNRYWTNFYWSEMDGKAHTACYKLYVSAHFEHLNDALKIVTEVAKPPSPVEVKFPSTVYGACRPDKLIAYFQSSTDLEKFAHKISGKVTNLKAQPTPLTFFLSSDGLLSCGLDFFDYGTRRTRSWRSSIAAMMASAISTLHTVGVRGEHNVLPLVHAKLYCFGINLAGSSATPISVVK